MKSAHKFLALLVLPLLMPFSAAAEETGVAELAKRTLFDSCVSTLLQEIDMDDNAALSETGLRRVPPEIEQKMIHPTFGAPKMAVGGTSEGVVSMSLYPETSMCSVMIQGPHASSGYDNIKSELASNPTVYTPDPDQSSEQPGMKIETYKMELEDALHYRVVMMTMTENGAEPVYIATIGFTQD